MSRLVRILKSARRIAADARYNNYFMAHPPDLPKISYYFSQKKEDFEEACRQSGIDLLVLEVFANTLRDHHASVELRIAREKYPLGTRDVPEVTVWKEHPKDRDGKKEPVEANQLFKSLLNGLPFAGVQQLKSDLRYEARYMAYVALGSAEFESLTKYPPSYYRRPNWWTITTRMERIKEYFSSRKMRKKVADFETGQCVLPTVVRLC